MQSEITPKTSNFTVRGGRFIVDGKPHWPDCLNVKMDKKDALSLLSSLATQIRDNEGLVHISYMGKLDYDLDE